MRGILTAVGLLLVLLNGFFVAAEFALVKLRLTQADQLAEPGGLRGRVLRTVRVHLDAYLSASQLGITLASLGLGWIGEPAFAKLLEPLLRFAGVENPNVVHGIAFAVAALGMPLPEVDANSVGGLVLEQLGRLPTVGERVAFPTFAIQILEVNGPRIGRVRIQPEPLSASALSLPTFETTAVEMCWSISPTPFWQCARVSGDAQMRDVRCRTRGSHIGLSAVDGEADVSG